MSDKVISFINPSRNNRKYLEWSYASVRKNLGYRHEICVASDYSTDGTVEWCEEIAKKDNNFKYIVNDGTWFGENTGEPSRMGHTLLYDKLINDVATNDIVMIWHSDMYALPNMDTEVLKHLKPGIVVSATRIEPPLHPKGPEKVLMDFGIEPEEFKEQELLKWYSEDYKPEQETTEGIFAPWAIYKKDFQSINGHDPLYAPQSKEDSDIFNRFVLAGYKLIQTREGCVYHMTCRGSRFADGAKRNPDGEVFMKNRETDEWLAQNQRSTRNFVRKWGQMVDHDSLLKPIITSKYNIGFKLTNSCDYNTLRELEPWCSNLYVDDKELIEDYINLEQPDTQFDLTEKLCKPDVQNDVMVEFNPLQLNKNNFQLLMILPKVIQDSGEIGESEIDIFKVFISSLKTYEKELIKCNIS